MTQVLHLVEDAAQAAALEAAFRELAPHLHVTTCSTPMQLRERFATAHPCHGVVVDDRVAGGALSPIVRHLRAEDPTVPVVLVTDLEGDAAVARRALAGVDHVVSRDGGVAIVPTLVSELRTPGDSEPSRLRVLVAGAGAVLPPVLTGCRRADVTSVSLDASDSGATPADPAWSSADALVLVNSSTGEQIAVALQRFRRLQPTMPVIVVAEERLREGFLRLDAFDCVAPAAGPERLEEVLERAARVRRVLVENAQLGAREARIRSVVENLPAGVVLTAADGVVLAANLAALALLGLSSAAEAVGRQFTTFVAVQDAQGLPALSAGDPPATLQLEAREAPGRRLIAQVAPHLRDEATVVFLIVLREAAEPAASAASAAKSAGVCQPDETPGQNSRAAEVELLLAAAYQARAQAEQACERLRQEATQARDALERERQAWRNANAGDVEPRPLADAVEDARTTLVDSTDSDDTRWALEAAGIGVALTTASGKILSCSDSAARLCGHLDSTTFEGERRLPGALLATGVPEAGSREPHRFEVCFQAPDGLLHWVLGSAAWHPPAPSAPAVLRWLLVDRSEHHRATLRSRFVRHMEGVTSLLTSAAADCTALVQESAAAEASVADAPPSTGTGDTPSTRAVLERVQAVVDQLARFAQTRARRPVVLPVNAALASLAPMLSWLAGEDTTLDIGCDPDELRVNADPADVEDLLAKMVMAGRDCLPAGGTLALRAGAARVDAVDDGVPVHRTEAALTLTARGHACEPITVPGALAQTVARLGGRVVVAEDPGHSARLSVRLVPVLGAVTDGPGADADRSPAADLSSRPQE